MAPAVSPPGTVKPVNSLLKGPKQPSESRRGSTTTIDRVTRRNSQKAVAGEADLREKPERALTKMVIDNAADAKHQVQLCP